MNLKQIFKCRELFCFVIIPASGLSRNSVIFDQKNFFFIYRIALFLLVCKKYLYTDNILTYMEKKH